MIAHDAAKQYLAEPNMYSVIDLRKKYRGEILIVGGKPYIVFPDESSLSIQKIVEAKFDPERAEA